MILFHFALFYLVFLLPDSVSINDAAIPITGNLTQKLDLNVFILFSKLYIIQTCSS